MRLLALLPPLWAHLSQGYVLGPVPLSPLSLLQHPALPPHSSLYRYTPLNLLSTFPVQHQALPYIQNIQPYPQILPNSVPVIQQIPQAAAKSALTLEEGTKSTFEEGTKFSPTRNVKVEPLTPLLPTLGRKAARNLDLCYFLGADIFNSHVRCNPNWADGSAEGVRRYINELTFETNQMLGENNFRISWKGPYERHDFYNDTPTDPQRDVYQSVNSNCDAVVFLVFNQFADDCKTETLGHDFGGVSYGGMCDQRTKGEGFTVVVDQGYLDDAWTGPQILAHHLLLMLTSDLQDASKHCGERESLLYPKLLVGEQRVDACVVDKLSRSGVSNRDCMLD